ncbi:MAG: hypothetical protein ABSE45_13295 [Candidatus Acidiferrales bacterium]|jgi:hypothetical protein
MGVEFRFANLREYPRISDFLHEHWAKNHVYTRDRALFDWSFHRPGHWDPESYSFSLAVDGDELVGILGGIPFTLNRFGQASKAVWIVNYVIRTDYRKGATALQLLSSFRKPEFSAVVAFGINPATVAIYQVLRGQVLPEIPRHFLVMPHQTERMACALHLAYPDWSDERAASLISGFELPELPVAPLQMGHSLPCSWDEIDWPEHASRTIGAARDADFLTWRYRNHPVFNYRFLTVPEGKRTGLAVWRLETIRTETPHGRKDVDLIGRLVEFLPASAANAEALFGAFVGELDRAGAMGADFYGYHGETRKWLQELGFRGAQSHPDGPAIPSRFQPLDGKGGGIMSAIFLRDGKSPGSDDVECPWYWTKSDSDQDRPN